MRLLTPVQARELDRISMAELDIPGKRLMGNAGRCVAEKALEMTADINEPAILILCGKGNNGGDGFAAAAILNEQNYPIQIHSIYDKKEIKNDSLYYYLKCEGLGIPVTFGSHIPEFKKLDLVIEGLLGTGFKGELRKDLIPWVDWINETGSKILSIDIPSGLDGNSGTLHLRAVKADATVTFGGCKTGMVFRNGPDHSGNVTVGEIGFPKLDELDLPGLAWNLYSSEDSKEFFHKPVVDAHKYSFGKVLVIAGSRGMTGAAMLATFGALRCGAGLTITTAPSSLNEIYERSIIEGITLSLEDGNSGILSGDHFDPIIEKVDWADSVVLGPGLGRELETQELIIKLVQSINKPLILDADGLFPFSGKLEKLNAREFPLLITPHLGELARLSGKRTDFLISDFPDVMSEIMAMFNHMALVKQVPSCTFYGKAARVNTSGNPGLATGGTGDVLAGMIASLIAQGLDFYEAASLGAFIHGKASDMLVAEKGFRGQIASDLLENIPGLIAEFEQS